MKSQFKDPASPFNFAHAMHTSDATVHPEPFAGEKCQPSLTEEAKFRGVVHSNKGLEKMTRQLQEYLTEMNEICVCHVARRLY